MAAQNVYRWSEDCGTIYMTKVVDACKFVKLIDNGWTVGNAGSEFGLGVVEAQAVYSRIKANKDKVRKAMVERERKYYSQKGEKDLSAV